VVGVRTLPEARPTGTSPDSGVKLDVPLPYAEVLRSARIDNAQLRELMQIRDGKAAFDLLVTLLTALLGPILFYIWPHPVVGVLCALLTIRVLNSFAQLVHGAGHGKLFSSRRLSEVVATFCAAMVGYSYQGHRAAHLEHHKHLNTEADADLIWGHPDEKTSDMVRRWIGDLLFASAVRRLAQYVLGDRHARTSAKPGQALPSVLGLVRTMAPVAIVQTALLMYYWALIGPQYYFLLYVLPAMTLYPAQIRLRSMAEHAFHPDALPEPDSNGVWVTRSIDANWLERFLMAPLCGIYHFEHHLLPAVPYYNLPRLRTILQSKGIVVPVAQGYVRFAIERWLTEARQASAEARQGA
jgi:fatty acid desaturase